MDELEFTLEKIGPTPFEKLAMAFLRNKGYTVNESGLSAADGGWDARVSINNQHGIAHASTQTNWARKLREDAKKVSDLEDGRADGYDIFIFITNQEVRGRDQLDLEEEIQQKYGWNLKIYHRNNLIGEMRTNHPGLANDFLDVDLRTDDDHFEKLLELRDKRIQKIRNRSCEAAELEQGPVVALHVIPNGIISKQSRKYSGELPGPPVLWEPINPYHEVRGKDSFAPVFGRSNEYCEAYGFIRNDGLFETAKSFAAYTKKEELAAPSMIHRREGFTIPMDVISDDLGFDACVVITVRRVLDILEELGFSGSALVSISFLDASELRYERRSPHSNRTGEALGKEQYVTDPRFVDIHRGNLLSELEPLLNEVWRELGLGKGTEKIEGGEWTGWGVSVQGDKLL